MSNLSTLPKGDSAWLLRKSIQRIMQQVSVLETNIGSSTTGNSLDKQVIFNDNGVLRGDTGLQFNSTTDTLQAGLLVVPGNTQLATVGTLYVGTLLNPKLKVDVGGTGVTTITEATITGDLTVDTNVLKVDSLNNRVGVNKATPAVDLDVGGTGRFQSTGSNWMEFGVNVLTSNQATGANIRSVVSSAGNPTYSWTGDSDTGLFSDTANTLQFTTGGTERARIDSSGNLGLGVTPSAWGGSYKALQLLSVARSIAATGAGVGDLTVAFNAIYDSTDSRWEYAGTGDKAGRYSQTGSGNHRWFVSNTAGTAGNEITDFASAAMTLDASGNLLVGLTVDSFAPAKGVSMFSGNSSRVAVGHANGTTSGDYYHSFAYNGSVIGSITQNGTTGVLYNINSDYRLKESIAPLSGGLARVNALKPSIYKWKSDGSAGEGFLAHELAEVVPFAVTGEKDAVNEDGTIKTQGIDMSRIVPILVAAIKELTAEVNALKNA